jgi:hypothetical protein
MSLSECGSSFDDRRRNLSLKGTGVTTGQPSLKQGADRGPTLGSDSILMLTNRVLAPVSIGESVRWLSGSQAAASPRKLTHWVMIAMAVVGYLISNAFYVFAMDSIPPAWAVRSD